MCGDLGLTTICLCPAWTCDKLLGNDLLHDSQTSADGYSGSKTSAGCRGWQVRVDVSAMFVEVSWPMLIFFSGRTERFSPHSSLNNHHLDSPWWTRNFCKEFQESYLTEIPTSNVLFHCWAPLAKVFLCCYQSEHDQLLIQLMVVGCSRMARSFHVLVPWRQKRRNWRSSWRM